MTLASQRLPLPDRRAFVLDYLRGIPLPFTSAAGTIVGEWLAAARERDLLRSTLVLWAGEACGRNTADALPVAAAFALVDCFMALHDELVDRAAESGTLARWGLGQSLNGGDALYALALRTLAEGVLDANRRLETAALVTSAVLEAIEGRTIDVERSARGAQNGLYARVRSLRRRSARLTAAALRAGALLAGAGADAARGFERAGRLLDAAGAAAEVDGVLAQRLGAKARAAILRWVADPNALDEFDGVVRFVATPAA